MSARVYGSLTPEKPVTIVEEGPPARIFDSPREERTKQFLGLVLKR